MVFISGFELESKVKIEAFVSNVKSRDGIATQCEENFNKNLTVKTIKKLAKKSQIRIIFFITKKINCLFLCTKGLQNKSIQSLKI